jgi:Phosphotransferase enzyme family
VVGSHVDTPWLAAATPRDVLDAVARIAPALAAGPAELHEHLEGEDSLWHRGTAWLGDGHVVKFAWSRQAGDELLREVRVMGALARTPYARFMPAIVASSEDPLLIITRRADGLPAWGEVLGDAGARASIGRDLGRMLSVLHDRRVLDAVEAAGIRLPPPQPQAETSAIRERLTRLIAPAEVPLVLGWCDWVDATLASRAGERVLLHGDLHGHNLLCNAGRVTLVLDYDGVSAGDHHYDLRYLPDMPGGIDLFRIAAEQYESITGRAVQPAPVLAWHIRTVLGDALWRTELGVPLPGGGTVHEWIAKLDQRIGDLAAWRRFDAPSTRAER